MFGTALPAGPDDPRSLWEIYDQFFPRVHLGNCSPLVLSDDIGDTMRLLKDTHHRLFISIYHDLAAQAVRVEGKIQQAIAESVEGDEQFEGANLAMLAVTRELSDEYVSAETKREIIQLMMDQRESLKQAFDNPGQEQAARFPLPPTETADPRPILEIYKSFFSDDGYSADIHELVMEMLDAENQEVKILLSELGGQQHVIDDMLFHILGRSSDESGEYIEFEDLQDCHLLPEEKIKLVQEMIDQREILMHKLLKAARRSS